VRINTAIILCLSVVLFIPVGVYGEPPDEPRIYFAAPYGAFAVAYGAGKDHILLGSFKPGLNVTLLKEGHICKATTGSTIPYETFGERNKATRLIGIDKCRNDLVIAVVGDAAESVQLMPPAENPIPLPKGIERKARRMVDSKGPDLDDQGLVDLPPEVLKTGKYTLLKFRWKFNSDAEKFYGPAVLFLDNEFFVMGHSCPEGHVFFSIDDQPYLAFIDAKCDSGAWGWVVYDLSGKKPCEVYRNADMAN
jgi:hypothetical protein